MPHSQTPSPVERPPDGTVSRDERQTNKLQEKFGSFRVLVVGRANSGKTAVLQGVCGTTEPPQVVCCHETLSGRKDLTSLHNDKIKAQKTSILSPFRYIHDKIKDKRTIIAPTAEVLLIPLFFDVVAEEFHSVVYTTSRTN